MPQKSGKGRRSTKRSQPKGDPTQVAVSKFAGDAYSLGARAIRGLNEIRKLINIETKFGEVGASTTQNATATITQITQLAEGVTNTTRVGQSIRLQTLEFDNFATVHASSTLSTAIRTIVFRDLENTGTAPVATDLLESASNPQAMSSAYVWNNLRRFAIIYDEVLLLNINNNNGGFQRLRVPHHGHVKYRGTDSSAASAGEGSVWMLMVSNQATNSPTVTWTFRITFTDD